MPPFLALTACLTCWPQEQAVDRLHGTGQDALSGEGLLGERFSLEALERRGVELQALFVADGTRVLSGGRREGEALRQLLDLGVELDLDTLLGARGRLHTGYQWIWGADGLALVGDLQGFSNLDAPRRSQLARFFWEGRLVEPGVETVVRAGKMDANAVFAVVEAGGRFLSSSAGYSPTVLGLPTYPDPAFGLTVGRFSEHGSGLRLGLFDGSAAAGERTGTLGPGPAIGAPSALFSIGEAVWNSGAGRFVVGSWWLDTELTRFEGGTSSGAAGMYGVAERRLVGGPEDASGTLDLFAQVGTAPAAVSPVRRHLAAGALWRGPLAGREADRLGLYASHVRAGADPATPGFGELELELFYSLSLAPWLRLEPDLQFIADPGAAALEDAWVFTLRVSASL